MPTALRAGWYFNEARDRDVAVVDVSDGSSACVLHLRRPPGAGSLEQLVGSRRIVALVGSHELVSWLGSAPDLPDVEALSLYDVTTATLESLAVLPLAPRLRQLVLCGRQSVIKLPDAFAQLVRLQLDDVSLVPDIALSLPALRELHVATEGRDELEGEQRRSLAAVLRVQAPLEKLVLQCARIPLAALARLETLEELDVIARGTCDDALIRLPALRRLHVRYGGDDVVQAFAACPVLEDMTIAGDAAGDDTVVAFADHPRLRRMDIMRTNVGDRGVLALEAHSHLESIELNQFRLSNPTRMELQLSKHAAFCRRVWSPEGTWLPNPEPPPVAAPRAAAWPAPPAGVTRSFVEARVVLCKVSSCNGYGWGSEGHCPDHSDPQLISECVDVPSDRLALCDDTIVDVERRVCAIGAVRRIVWVERRGSWRDRPAAPFVTMLDVPERLAELDAWPYAWRAVARRRGATEAQRIAIDHAVAILERGARLGAIEEGTATVVFQSAERYWGW